MDRSNFLLYENFMKTTSICVILCNLFVVNRMIKKISYVQDAGWQNTQALCSVYIRGKEKRCYGYKDDKAIFNLCWENIIVFVIFFELASHIYLFNLSYIWYINGRRNKFIEEIKIWRQSKFITWFMQIYYCDINFEIFLNKNKLVYI